MHHLSREVRTADLGVIHHNTLILESAAESRIWNVLHTTSHAERKVGGVCTRLTNCVELMLQPHGTCDSWVSTVRPLLVCHNGN